MKQEEEGRDLSLTYWDYKKGKIVLLEQKKPGRLFKGVWIADKILRQIFFFRLKWKSWSRSEVFRKSHSAKNSELLIDSVKFPKETERWWEKLLYKFSLSNLYPKWHQAINWGESRISGKESWAKGGKERREEREGKEWRVVSVALIVRTIWI